MWCDKWLLLLLGPPIERTLHFERLIPRLSSDLETVGGGFARPAAAVEEKERRVATRLVLQFSWQRRPLALNHRAA